MDGNGTLVSRNKKALKLGQELLADEKSAALSTHPRNTFKKGITKVLALIAALGLLITYSLIKT